MVPRESGGALRDAGRVRVPRPAGGRVGKQLHVGEADLMSLWLILGLAWFGLAVLAWACMISAALGDRPRVRPPAVSKPRSIARPRTREPV